MSEGNGWKRYLLSSGIPLEHEVANELVKHQVYVESEFEFIRKSEQSEKEFSTDLLGKFYKENNKGIAYAISFLCECKYRSREKTLLFFEDPNDESFAPTLGHTISYIDEFSSFHLDSTPIYHYENRFPFVYKGIEIFEKGAAEQDIRHGINQLKYASPPLVKREVLDMINSHKDDRHPIFFTKILVTNSPIRVFKSNISISEIEKSKSIEDISYESSCVIYYSNIGPDFQSHYDQYFSSIDKEGALSSVKEISYDIENDGKKFSRFFGDPVKFIDDLFSQGYASRRFMTQNFVVNLQGLPELIAGIKKSSHLSYMGRRKSRNLKPRKSKSST